MSDLALAARSIFQGDQTEFALANGTTVKIVPAKMKHLDTVMTFFGAIAARLDPSVVTEIVNIVAERQIKAMAAGKQPSQIDLNDLGAEQIVVKALGKTTLVSALISAVAKELPTLAPAFTNLTQEQFEELDADEGMVVATGIFLVNYRFFTQSLRPIAMEFVQGLARKQQSVSK